MKKDAQELDQALSQILLNVTKIYLDLYQVKNDIISGGWNNNKEVMSELCEAQRHAHRAILALQTMLNAGPVVQPPP